MSHTLTLENGELLTGRTWRKANQLFTALPFFTHLLRADDNIVEPLQNALAVSTLDRRVKEGLIVCHIQILSYVSPLMLFFTAYCRWSRKPSPLQRDGFGCYHRRECKLDPRPR
jgi:hypothetical protein